MDATTRCAVCTGLAAAVLSGCAGGPAPVTPPTVVASTSRSEHTFGAVSVRRTIDQSYANSPDFGAPRGRRFEDIVPLGARVSAVHAVIEDRTVQAIWLSYEGNGREGQTVRRGAQEGHVETFELRRDEKIIGIHAYGRGSIDALTIATNRRNHTFGAVAAAQASPEIPWFEELTEEQRQQYVGVGLTGRADEILRQVALRIQVQDDAVAAAQQ